MAQHIVKVRRIKKWTVKADRKAGACMFIFEMFDGPPEGFSVPLSEVRDMAEKLASLVPSSSEAKRLN